MHKLRTFISLLRNLDRLPAIEQKVDALMGRGSAGAAAPTVEFGLPKDRVCPNANFAPWHTDEVFLSAYSLVRNFTAVDIFRCYEIWRTVGQLRTIKGNVLEIGVWKGGTTLLIAEAIRAFGIDAEFYACDTFEGMPSASQKDPFYRGGEFADTSLQAVAESMRLTSAKVRLIQGTFPQQGADQIPSAPIRFAHIDVDIYDSAKNVFEWIWPRLAAGGAVLFDDYGFVDCAGVTNYVNNEIYGRSGRVMFHNLNGHAIVVKTEQLTQSGTIA